MKPRSLLWSCGALLALLMLAPAPAHAALVPMFKECMTGGDPTKPLCGFDSTRQGAGTKALKLYCELVVPTGIGAFGGTCETYTWYPNGDYLGYGVLWVRESGGIGHHTDLPGTYFSSSGPIDTCTIATGISGPCGATVAQLKAIVKAPDDPTRVFHRTLTCITASSCALRCNMDNCDWLKEVVPLFNNKYLNQVEEWPQIIADCRARGTGLKSDLRCAEQEGRHHIFFDLLPALTASGCGSENDWDKVYEAIKTCTGQSAEGLFPGAGKTAAFGTYAYRSAARVACITVRASAGMNVAINPNTQGQICTP